MGYAAAPTSVSMLHAGVLKKLGAYAIIRLGIGLMPDGAALWMPTVAWIAVINIIYCGFVAFTQKDLKYILGYSSCSHMGYILLGLSCLTPIELNGTPSSFLCSASNFTTFGSEPSFPLSIRAPMRAAYRSKANLKSTNSD